jgi:Pentapeptide repeats (8 copies)
MAAPGPRKPRTWLPQMSDLRALDRWARVRGAVAVAVYYGALLIAVFSVWSRGPGRDLGWVGGAVVPLSIVVAWVASAAASRLFLANAPAAVAKSETTARERFVESDASPSTLEDREPALRPAMAGIDLRGIDLGGADLSRADLRRSRLEGARLSRALLERALLSEARLDGADLRGAHPRRRPAWLRESAASRPWTD